MLEHYLDRIDPDLQGRIAEYLLSIQGDDGGWPLFHGGKSDLSGSVKAYFALKAAGHDPGLPHMVRGRERILAMGGAERTNVFTRIQLALFGQVPWRATPVMPVEIMHLPRWFFFHLSKVSYWSRTVMVPLLVLMALQPRARNPRGVAIPELFRTPPDQVRDWIRGPYRSAWGIVFKTLDSVLRPLVPHFPAKARKRAMEEAVAFVLERLNGEDGLGAIYPAMANSVMMFDAMGFDLDHPPAATAWGAVRKLLVVQLGRSYCQPCLSPVWDTGLAGHAMIEAEGGRSRSVQAACHWLAARQVTTVKGDWAWLRPDAPPGGWAFQYENAHYPDVDDTAVVAMLLHRAGDPAHDEAVSLARDWILGMQSKNGGWGAFDADNDYQFLNHIPFADHGALLDPPTVDVTARCLSFLAQIGHGRQEPALARALDYLRREQEADGSWFGRWGTNYIYGTWSALCALNALGLPPSDNRCPRRCRVAARPAAAGWRLGRGRGELRRRPARRVPNKHAVADRLGAAGPDGGWRGGASGGGAWDRLSRAHAEAGRRVGRGVLHRGRVPAGVLPALPRLPAVLPVAGAGPLPHSVGQRHRPGRVRVLTYGFMGWPWGGLLAATLQHMGMWR